MHITENAANCANWRNADVVVFSLLRVRMQTIIHGDPKAANFFFKEVCVRVRACLHVYSHVQVHESVCACSYMTVWEAIL